VGREGAENGWRDEEWVACMRFPLEKFLSLVPVPILRFWVPVRDRGSSSASRRFRPPSSAPRCKRWRRLVLEPHFLHRLSSHLLGFIYDDFRSGSIGFISTLDSPDRIPAAHFSLQLEEYNIVLDCLSSSSTGRSFMPMFGIRSPETTAMWPYSRSSMTLG
jgi:hypothetical protein